MTNPAESYENFMVPVLFAPLARELVIRAHPRSGERVLDVGCGTGIVARTIAAHWPGQVQVTGIDIAKPMLDIARSKSEMELLDITWREGPAESLPFEAGSFDLVTCQTALMFFQDRPAAVSEMRRVLVDEGRMAVTVFQSIDQHPFYQALHEHILRHLGASGVADIFSLGDRGLLCDLMTQAGFQDIVIHDVELESDFGDVETFIAGEIDVDTASIPTMQHLSEDDRARLRQTIRDEMSDSLEEVTENGRVQMPFSIMIATATR
jgi:SAM-dependent methyltransferase